MDPLSEVLSLLEPRSYKLGGFDGGAAWSLRFGAHDGIKCYSVVAGGAWLAVDGEAPVWLSNGDCFLLPRGRPFRVATDLSLPAEDYQRYFSGTTRVNGLIQVDGGGTVAVVGAFFQLDGPHAGLLLGMLPPLVVLQSEADKAALRWSFERMRQELANPQPGSALITQQLATMILVQAIRLHLAEAAGEGVGWLFALADRQIGAAITAIHAAPARRWTVEALAAEAGMSRSSFAARFKAMVGKAPLAYVTRWRMVLAGERLARRGDPVGVVALALGYESESAFSTAFKREMGISPRTYLRTRNEPVPLAEAA
jgi:AraC-like DNA-binding protein